MTTLLLLCGTLVARADERPSFALPAPTSWTREVIALPPPFAPDMTLIGTEYVRFSPGMMKRLEPSFFSYAFLLKVKRPAKLSPQTLQKELLAYYRGLNKAVLRGADCDPQRKDFTLQISESHAPTSAEKTGVPSLWSARAKLIWSEPFVTRQRQTLNLDIDVFRSDGLTYVLVCVSPQPRSADIWKRLRTIRADFIRTLARK